MERNATPTLVISADDLTGAFTIGRDTAHPGRGASSAVQTAVERTFWLVP